MKGQRTIDPDKLPDHILKLNPGIKEAIRDAFNSPAPAPRMPAAAFSGEKGPVVAEKEKPEKKPNGTEAEYEAMLKRENPGCHVLFEKYTLKLARGLTYRPDFAVVSAHHISFHEVKSKYLFKGAHKSATTSSLTKPRTAAAMYHWHTFYIAQKIDGNWTRELCHPA